MNKKNFKNDNPALTYITHNQPEKNKMTGNEDIKYKPNPRFVETRSKKMQILIQPTVFKKLKEYSQENNQSVNETVNQVIKKFLNLEEI